MEFGLKPRGFGIGFQPSLLSYDSAENDSACNFLLSPAAESMGLWPRCRDERPV